MYRNLEAEIIRNNLNKALIAETIRKTVVTLNQKINCNYPFTYDEALDIQEKYFPELEIKYLFLKTTA